MTPRLSVVYNVHTRESFQHLIAGLWPEWEPVDFRPPELGDIFLASPHGRIQPSYIRYATRIQDGDSEKYCRVILRRTT